MNIYGPVPSRRLGYSLGIDIIPFKTCTFDCIYCQLGSTTSKTIKRKKCFSSREILSAIKKKLASNQRIDCITFSGSGEPTLNSSIGKLIREIKKITNIPVVVLTNGSLLTRTSVRKDLMAADIVVPSLDAFNQEAFIETNRPHSLLKLEEIIDGLTKFRQEFKGSIWLEIMLIKGINDSPPHIRRLKDVIAKINPEKIHLNTVVRPPTEKFARPLSLKELERIQKILGKKAEIIAGFDKRAQKPPSEDFKKAILSIIRRRPVTLRDISTSLGANKNEVIKYLSFLLEEGKIQSATHKGLKYYKLK